MSKGYIVGLKGPSVAVMHPLTTSAPIVSYKASSQ